MREGVYASVQVFVRLPLVDLDCAFNHFDSDSNGHALFRIRIDAGHIGKIGLRRRAFGLCLLQLEGKRSTWKTIVYRGIDTCTLIIRRPTWLVNAWPRYSAWLKGN